MLFYLIEKLKPFQPIYLHVEPNEQTQPNSAYWHLQHKELYISKLRNILKVITLSTISVLVGLVVGYQWRSPNTIETTDGKLYSPFVEGHQSATRSRLVQFDARIHHPTPYGGPASPAVDRLWQDLAVNWTTVSIPEQLGKKANLGGSALIKRRDKDGTPILEYFASVEVFHQLHCLDLLRKAAQPNYNYYSQLGEHMFHDNELYQLSTHIGHCVDILRQSLVCNPDYALIGYVHVDGQDFPVPNFPAVKHQCRPFESFEELRRWTEENAVRELGLEDLLDRTDERITVLSEAP